MGLGEGGEEERGEEQEEEKLQINKTNEICLEICFKTQLSQ